MHYIVLTTGSVSATNVDHSVFMHSTSAFYVRRYTNSRSKPSAARRELNVRYRKKLQARANPATFATRKKELWGSSRSRGIFCEAMGYTKKPMYYFTIAPSIVA